MARRPARVPPKPSGTLIPADWRWSGWQVAPMLSSIPPSDYEATATAFEAYHRRHGTVSDEWRVMWSRWCLAVLLEKRRAAKAPVAEIGVGMFD